MVSLFFPFYNVLMPEFSVLTMLFVFFAAANKLEIQISKSETNFNSGLFQ